MSCGIGPILFDVCSHTLSVLGYWIYKILTRKLHETEMKRDFSLKRARAHAVHASYCVISLFCFQLRANNIQKFLVIDHRNNY